MTCDSDKQTPCGHAEHFKKSPGACPKCGEVGRYLELASKRDAAAANSQCQHDWDLIGEHEQYALHGPDEIGDPLTVYGWKCQKPECGAIENTITGEPPVVDEQADTTLDELLETIDKARFLANRLGLEAAATRQDGEQ